MTTTRRLAAILAADLVGYSRFVGGLMLHEQRRAISDEQWLPGEGPPRKNEVVGLDRRPLSERSKLVDRGLVDFRRVCEHMGILDPVNDVI